jgi:hypothetical protein
MAAHQKVFSELNISDLVAILNKLTATLKEHSEELKSHKNTLGTLEKTLENLESTINNASGPKISHPSPRLKRVIIDFVETYINPKFYKIPTHAAMNGGSIIPCAILPAGNKSADSLSARGNILSVAPKSELSSKTDPHLSETIKTIVPTASPPGDKVEEAVKKPRVRIKSPVKDIREKHPFLVELENNLAIARKPAPDQPTKFPTAVWLSCKSELNSLDLFLHQELNEVYELILLANNIVWLVTELGSKSQDITNNYLNLQAKIAERLDRVIPVVSAVLK